MLKKKKKEHNNDFFFSWRVRGTWYESIISNSDQEWFHSRKRNSQYLDLNILSTVHGHLRLNGNRTANCSNDTLSKYTFELWNSFMSLQIHQNLFLLHKYVPLSLVSWKWCEDQSKIISKVLGIRPYSILCFSWLSQHTIASNYPYFKWVSPLVCNRNQDPWPRLPSESPPHASSIFILNNIKL